LIAIHCSRIDCKLPKPQALCICPTRELAVQIATVVKSIGQFIPNFDIFLAVAEAIVPPIVNQQVIIGTPGTVIDILKNKRININEIKVLVVDEADAMLGEQSLGDQTLKLRERISPKCQILLFSATYSPKVQQYTLKFVPEPRANILLKRKEITLDQIQQLFITAKDRNYKFDILNSIYEHISIGQSIVFVNSRQEAKDLNIKMKGQGHETSVIYGKEMSPSERDNVIKEFRNGKSKVLISTNVLARGIDILQCTLVINYDMPVDAKKKPDPETYIHRIGRTGRWNQMGIAINIIGDEEAFHIQKEIERITQRKIEELAESNIPKLESMLSKLRLNFTQTPKQPTKSVTEVTQTATPKKV